MDITLTPKAAEEGILRVWLRRIPEESYIVHAFRQDDGPEAEPIGTATIFGRGEGSAAREKAMLMIRLTRARGSRPLKPGEALTLCSEAADGSYEALDLDVIETE
ncbi:hypothetical protein [Vannielia litorea]|uniref:hypothetical protein n=1 Tax=Vannielia litorea TaxID=1217970 RepID=UPI001BCAE8B9|nr:hypothetical protein [Vannielia litorea]MBS8226210.1 hypothetical protein [Vannielia litorea]